MNRPAFLRVSAGFGRSTRVSNVRFLPLEDLKEEYHVDLTFEVKRKILGENAARLYGIDIAAQTAKLSQDGIGLAR